MHIRSLFGSHIAIWMFLLIVIASHCSAGFAQENIAGLKTFIESNCYDCHSGSGSDGDFDIEKLSKTFPSQTEDWSKWVEVFDRVTRKEMPPRDASDVSESARKSFLASIAEVIKTGQKNQQAKSGRVQARRLTNLQLERTLHDLLGVDIPVKDLLPEELRLDEFNSIANTQAMSRFHIQGHLDAIDLALNEAFRRATSRPDEFEKLFSAKELSRRQGRVRNREPELIDGHAVTWSARIQFYGRIPRTTVREAGWYRFEVKAKGLKIPEDSGIWCKVRSGKCISSAPMMSWVGQFEAKSDESTRVFEGWMEPGDMLEIRPGDVTLKQARFRGGQVGTGEGGPQNVPGVAIRSIKMNRIHKGPANWSVRKSLFADLELKKTGKGPNSKFELVLENPKTDLVKPLRRMATRAFRRPVTQETLAPYVAMMHQALDNGDSPIEALRVGYRTILCSPRFLYFNERPGELDGYALASRLSYLFWNTMPDKELLQHAKSGKLLSDKKLYVQQVRRLLDHPKAKNFVEDFSNEWLDLALIDFTEPDRKLFPTFDIHVEKSMLEETHLFLKKLVKDNLSVTNLVNSEFTFLNSRLARYYKIPGVAGDQMNSVRLKPKHHRGGLLTQGSVLKVTANGSNTSPVIRGVWICERILGVHIPPPPQNVPAIEPDIRGAKTIRQQLFKHRNNPDCASCHKKIDPPGFALENYDPAGQYREFYTILKGRRRAKGAEINTSYSLANGKRFKDFEDFRKLIINDKQVLARNFASKVLTYGTGAPVSFADREALNRFVEFAARSDYGMRDLIITTVSSPMFKKK